MSSKLIRKFIAKNDGVAAIEFAILAPVFFALMTAIFEITLFVYSNSATQRAVENVIYDLRTGHVYNAMAAAGSPPTDEWFKSQICNQVSIPNCLSTVQVTTEQFDSDYNSVSNSDDTGQLQVGASGILMRVEAQVTVPNIAFTEAIFGEENMTIQAGLTFMTEPY